MSIVSDKKKRDDEEDATDAERSEAELGAAGVRAPLQSRELASRDADAEGDADEADAPQLTDEELDAQALLADAESEERALKEAESVGDAPVVFGTQRFVFAAYFAGAIGAAFIGTKILTGLWRLLAKYKPTVGEPKDELLYGLAGVFGVALAVYYWRKPSARQYADEVAEELAKVNWPSKKEVQNSTIVVVATTIGAAAFFAVLDLMWRYVTDKIYGI